MMNAASVLLSPRCEYKIFWDKKEISNHKADEYLQLCTVQFHVMNYRNALRICIRIYIAYCYIQISMLHEAAFCIFLMSNAAFSDASFPNLRYNSAVERENGIAITHTKTQQTKMKVHVNVALSVSVCGYLPANPQNFRHSSHHPCSSVFACVFVGQTRYFHMGGVSELTLMLRNGILPSCCGNVKQKVS